MRTEFTASDKVLVTNQNGTMYRGTLPQLYKYISKTSGSNVVGSTGSLDYIITTNDTQRISITSAGNIDIGEFNTSSLRIPILDSVVPISIRSVGGTSTGLYGIRFTTSPTNSFQVGDIIGVRLKTTGAVVDTIVTGFINSLNYMYILDAYPYYYGAANFEIVVTGSNSVVPSGSFTVGRFNQNGSYFSTNIGTYIKNVPIPYTVDNISSANFSNQYTCSIVGNVTESLYNGIQIIPVNRVTAYRKNRIVSSSFDGTNTVLTLLNAETEYYRSPKIGRITGFAYNINGLNLGSNITNFESSINIGTNINSFHNNTINIGTGINTTKSGTITFKATDGGVTHGSLIITQKPDNFLEDNIGMFTDSPKTSLEINSRTSGSSGLSFTLFNSGSSNSSGAPIGVDKDGNVVKIGNGYKVYTALLSQSGFSDPIATVLENTLGAYPVWSRDPDKTGQYYCSAGSGIWVANKTAILIGSSNSYWDGLSNLSGQRIDNTNLQFNTVNNLGELCDGIFYETMVEIRVYN